jgi:deoxyribodipyrimidine photolyase-like uncharacterized protein
MREDMGLCTYQKHHKQKIILFLSSMRSYKDELEEANYKVHYEYINIGITDTYIESLIKYIKSNKVKRVSIFEIEDKWFEEEVNQIRSHVDELIVVDIFPRVTDTGYYGDMTRTFLKGKASDAQKHLVGAVTI